MLGNPIRRGMTLVELLAVIAIVGLLMGLLVPAIQSARESSRRVSCGHNLKQIGIAVQHHVSANSFFPTDGWAPDYIGDPDKGVGWQQPGGWMFNILPYFDQMPIFQMQTGLSGTARAKAAVNMMKTVIPGAQCPSRRAAAALPNSISVGVGNSFFGITVNLPPVMAKADYAVNAGTKIVYYGSPLCPQTSCPTVWALNWSRHGPPTYAAGTTGDAPKAWGEVMAYNTGVSFAGSTVTPAHVRDGLGFTYFCGEKYLQPLDYLTGAGNGDAWNPYLGDVGDNCRWGAQAPLQDSVGYDPPYPYGFGSAHADAVNMLLCDGSVRAVAYTISGTTHANLSNRKDAQIVSLDSL